MTQNTKAVLDEEVNLPCYSDFIVKKKQYLESSGIITIQEPGHIIILSAVVSGICNMKDITNIIIKHVGQSDQPFLNDPGCNMNKMFVDTGKLNIFTCGDINPGIQKLLQVVYITKHTNIIEEHIKCKSSCLNEICFPKKVHEYYCDYIDDERYICFNEEVVNNKQHVARCLVKYPCNRKERRGDKCKEHLKKCDKERRGDKCKEHLKKCDKERKGNKCKEHLKKCDKKRKSYKKCIYNNCSRKCYIKPHNMLIFPLYPICKPFIYNCLQKCCC